MIWPIKTKDHERALEGAAEYIVSVFKCLFCNRILTQLISTLKTEEPYPSETLGST